VKACDIAANRNPRLGRFCATRTASTVRPYSRASSTPNGRNRRRSLATQAANPERVVAECETVAPARPRAVLPHGAMGGAEPMCAGAGYVEDQR
jgi:hypothetical protein